jgi:predicted ATPase/DNA-binding CsgD family transcriptional regulator
VGEPADAIAAGGMHGFPAVLTSFIGRVGPLREVAGLLDGHRLVTVTGPGGSGKTRLAWAVARRMAGRFAEGVWLAELLPAADPAAVGFVVAAALGVRDLPEVPTGETLARVLARRQLLVVLDNCEHVIDAAAELCAGLLAGADDVRVLATSREPLAVSGEARYRLAPLALPDPDDLAGATRAEAVALFTDRARSADSGFALDERTGPAVARLVRRLDGMPLAIELAAARVEVLGVSGLLDRMDDRFVLLAGGNRMAPSRQRSLAATVEWSYQLLDEHGRRVFRAVSVFPGPFTLEAAEAVAGAEAGPVVLGLVDCSMLSPPQAGPDGRSRYVMLETLRAYAAGLLAQAGEQDQAAAALAGYALGVAEEAAAGLATTSREAAAARWLDAEDATTRQVLAWTMAHDPATGLRLVIALGPWWFLRGRLTGQRPLLHEAVGHGIPGDDAWCAAQFWLGTAMVFSADLAGALDCFTAVRDVIGDRGPSRTLVDCLASRSVVLSNLGRLAEAIEDGNRALALARELGYPAGEVWALERLSIAALLADDLDGAVRLAQQSQRVLADIPGWIARLCSSFLAQVLVQADELAAAERICAATISQSRDVGDAWALAALLDIMARLDLQAGRTDDAAAQLREGLQIIARTGSQFELRDILGCCGFLCAATGRPAEVLTLWAARAAIFPHERRADFPANLRRRDEALRAARRALGDARARAAEERGAAMSLATAAEYALMLTAPGPHQPQATPGLAKLSARERELVTLVAQGRTNAQIAAQLYISVRTVGSHLDRIRDKTGCRRRADLTRLALTEGLV